MFVKGFICGWVGMAAIVVVLIWGITPRSSAAGVYTPDAPSHDAAYGAC